ncbi:MAG: DUF1858 domain-containing protein [Aquificota bacterium]|jgi:hypothetical protein|nr:DUF1858 domain-containing protein [Aquificaceae bacterium]MDM7267092.1 DUF1858 domain-containing protein [Aquificaceae bacterium]QWK13400.1 MAG: DUF1858 domain-containing protein [Aquificota bacterium]HAV40307.1 hypothetical protein [Aquificaceae bacterium]HCO39367.1 hypothetical protein [Aquificaceae bacterium]
MKERITFDISLTELFQSIPEAKEVLMKYGYSKLVEEDIEDVVVDKLTLKGFCRLMDLDEEAQGNLWQEIQDLYRKVEE